MYCNFEIICAVPPYSLTVHQVSTSFNENCRFRKVKQRFLQQSKGCNSKINDPIWLVFKFMWDFIHAHLIWKCQEKLIKTEWVMLMSMSNRGFFSNQEDITLKLRIQSGQFFNLSEILSMSTLSASFRKIWSKLNKLLGWQSQTEAFFSNQGDVTKITCQFFILSCPRIHPCPPYLQVSGTSNQNWRSYGDDKHIPILSLWGLVVGIATKVFFGFPPKAYAINPPPEACYRWEMIEISLQTVEI